MKESIGLLIPLYIDPLTKGSGESQTDWQFLCELKRTHRSVSVIAIINPDNGPGDDRRSQYTEGIGQLQDAGIDVVGYVATGYMRRSDDELLKSISDWMEWYPSIDGIFLDEIPNRASGSLVIRYERLFSSMDSRLSIVNPGTVLQVDPSVRSLPFDIAVSWEERRYPESSSSLKQIDEFSHLSAKPDLGCLVLEQKINRSKIRCRITPYYDWFFVNPFAVEENPWGRLDRKMCRKLFRLCR